MSYFSNFPITSIVRDANELTVVQARNILVRAKFSNYIKNNDSLFDDYLISDGEKPETLAYQVYGRSDLHWIILLFNEMINPYYDWPLSQRELDSQLNYKYPGIAVYVSDTFVYSDGAKAELPILTTEPVLTKPITAVIGNTIVNVLSYDPLFGKMVVTGYTNTDLQRLLETIGTDDLTFDVNNDGKVDSADIGTTLGNLGTSTTENNTISLTNSNGIKIKTKIIHTEENKTALHHFEDKYGNWLDPRGRINTVSGGDATERIKVYTSPLRSTIASVGGVSNYDYESFLNERKRNISLLKAKYVNSASKEFSDLFK